MSSSGVVVRSDREESNVFLVSVLISYCHEGFRGFIHIFSGFGGLGAVTIHMNHDGSNFGRFSGCPPRAPRASGRGVDAVVAPAVAWGFGFRFHVCVCGGV